MLQPANTDGVNDQYLAFYWLTGETGVFVHLGELFYKALPIFNICLQYNLLK